MAQLKWSWLNLAERVKPVAADPTRTDLAAGEFVMLKPADSRLVRSAGLPENTVALIKRGDSFGLANPYTGRVQAVGKKKILLYRSDKQSSSYRVCTILVTGR